jgi:hypothetical protein
LNFLFSQNIIKTNSVNKNNKPNETREALYFLIWLAGKYFKTKITSVAAQEQTNLEVNPPLAD